MRFVQFLLNGSSRLGVELKEGGDIVDLNAGNKSLPGDMKTFIEQGQQSLQAAKSIVESGQHVVKRENIELLAPITDCDKVICIGMNYKDHCEEQKCPVPVEPIIFSKFSSTLIGPHSDIEYPSETTKSDAMQHVFGYTVAHDVSARDWQMKKNGGQWIIGKSMDGFCPLGPAIVMKEDIEDPHNLRLYCRVNGVTKQDSSTCQIVHKTEDLIAFISRLFTLRSGDVVLTGTPPGVGVFRKPPEFLKKGDVVECEIENIGKLVNKIV
ncbi:fumarylacetoacetate hydrolase domain-containing protein 2-like isoform X2 [Gigantopelta aegis]|uniref:fumarylacetoacetate hydrolase domain-containing protein 2-like isoform X2 n=1 Tax=Gigantopelta aegis TaxID=1735272 RepID=UPI001B88A507|nr:fumarylacetoacetate hydrolase domain-containing protein 2-like isoform X2 [Gigantopelta aegis]